MDLAGSERGRASSRAREPQQARSRATRARVVRATAELIEKQGYERTSMAEIAQQSGIGTGTLYHHFPDKRAIFLELIDAWGDRCAAERRSDLQLEALMGGGDPRAALAAFLRRVYERLQHGTWLYAEIFRLLDRDEEVRRRCQHLEQAGAERLAAVIEFGQQRGLLRRQPDAMTAAFLLINAIELLMRHVLVLRRPGGDAERVLSELTDMLGRYLVEDA